jgi:hypothetical protein
MWTQDGTIVRNNRDYGLWSREAARKTGAVFIDLNDIVARRYETMGPGELKARFFQEDHTHTTLGGARLNAACIVEGLQRIDDFTLNEYLTESIGGR